MTTYYVSKTGNDTNPGTSAEPRLTLASGASLLVSGDTLVIRDGEYNEVFADVIPSGTSGLPTIVRSENPLGAILKPSSQGILYLGRGIVGVSSRSYIQFDGFVLDASTIGGVAHFYLRTGTNNITIQNCEMKGGADINSPVNTTAITSSANAGECHHITIRDNKIHDLGNGALEAQNFYCSGIFLNMSDCLIEHNEIYNCSGYAIESLNEANVNFNARNRISANRIHNNAADSHLVAVLFAAQGSDNVIYNNLIYSNGGDGIQVGGLRNVTAQRNGVYNNTIYGNAGVGIRVGSSLGGAVDTTIRNNICFQNGTNTVVTQNATNTTTGTDNLFGVDPIFVDASSQNFHLRSTSVNAIDRATPLPSFFLIDFDGINRGSQWDIGAYEFETLAIDPTRYAIWYTFETGTGTQAFDISGNLRHGTFVGSPQWSTGRLGRFGVRFPSGNDRIEMNTTFSVGAFTIAFSFQTENPINGSAIRAPFSMDFNFEDNLTFFLDFTSNTALQRVWDFFVGATAAETLVKYNTVFQPNTFYRIHTVVNGTQVQLYVNGVLEVTASCPALTGSITNVTLNRFNQGIIGTIDDFILTTFPLTNIEVMSDYIQHFNPPLRPKTPNPIRVLVSM